MSQQVVIVTDNCYLVCKAINYITINDFGEDQPKADFDFDMPRRRKQHQRSQRSLTEKERDARRVYRIVVDFVPLDGSPMPQQAPTFSRSTRNSADTYCVEMTITGKDNVHKVFRDMIEQLREQLPDQLFLDKLFERMFAK